MAAFSYPVSPRGDVVDTLDGVAVPDSYRWLEDANSEETRDWVEAQNVVTRRVLDAIPGREAIAKRLRRLWDYDRVYGVRRAGDRYLYFHNDGLQNQAVLYVTQGLEERGRILLDPNAFSEDGTVALSGTSVSRDGSMLAYSVSRGGSDWQEWRVREIATGEDLADTIRWSKFSGASWAQDGAGFYYAAYDAPADGQALQEKNLDQRLMFHRLGTPQSEDVLVYARPDHPEWGLWGSTTEDGRYLVITVRNGTNREKRIFVQHLAAAGGPVRDLLPQNDASYGFVGNDGSRIFFLTDKDAPTGRVIAVDADNPDRWETVVSSGEATIEDVSMAGDFLFVTRLVDATSEAEQFDLQGNSVRRLQLPALGTAGVGSAKRDATELFYAFTSTTAPTTVYRLELASGRSAPFRPSTVAFDASAYETRRLFYPSKDGTRVPLFVTAKKGLALDGTNPTLLYGYGGFNVSLTPSFSPKTAAWLEMGGVYAVACIRGGGEYGKAWHDGGRLQNKQNCYDDFIAAAEFLVAEGYTSTSKLGCMGGSNGGLLIGAVVNQRPDLWGAAIPKVGVMDLVRFPLFTIGWAWTSDFGDPQKPDELANILRISPLHNLRPGTIYPPVLVMTGDHDDRVVPAHSYKYIAALQAAQSGDSPVLIRIDVAAGHGAGKPTAKLIDEAADEWAFLAQNLGMQVVS